MKLYYCPEIPLSPDQYVDWASIYPDDQYISPQRATNTLISRFNRAKLVAATGDCNFLHGALLMQGNRTLAVGINTYTTDIYATPPSSDKIMSTHAEVASLKLYAHTRVPNLSLYVARLSSSATMTWRNSVIQEPTTLPTPPPRALFSRPCRDCLEYLSTISTLKAVYYT